MPTPQLIDYIKQARASGMMDDAIRTALLGAGWQGPDIEEGLAQAGAPAPVVSRSSKALIAVVSLAAVFLLSGGGFAYYWFFMKEPERENSQRAQEAVQQEQPKRLSGQKVIEDIPVQEATTNQIQREESIQEILAKVEKNAPIAYSSKQSDGTSTSLIADSDDVLSQQLVALSFIQISRKMRNNESLRVVGSEVLDGKQTTIVEYNETAEGISFIDKAWIWNEKGVPLRTQTTYYSSDNIPVRTVETNYSDFIFIKLPTPLQ